MIIFTIDANASLTCGPIQRIQETLARAEAAKTAEERLARLIAVRFTRQRLLAATLVKLDFRAACHVARLATPDARLT